MFGSDFTPILIMLVVLAGLFIILREFMCWYWKQNKIVDLLQEINDKLAGKENPLLEPANLDTTSQSTTAAPSSKVTKTEWICTCGTKNPLDKTKKIQNCSECGKNRDFVLKNS